MIQLMVHVSWTHCTVSHVPLALFSTMMKGITTMMMDNEEEPCCSSEGGKDEEVARARDKPLCTLMLEEVLTNCKSESLKMKV